MRMPRKIRHPKLHYSLCSGPHIYSNIDTDEPKTTFVRPKYNLILFIQSYYFVIFILVRYVLRYPSTYCSHSSVSSSFMVMAFASDEMRQAYADTFESAAK